MAIIGDRVVDLRAALNKIVEQQSEIERLRAELDDATKDGTPDWHEGEVMSFLVMENQNQQVEIERLRARISKLENMLPENVLNELYD
jgi:uncharacterized small protein (DUF1192 family)